MKFNEKVMANTLGVLGAAYFLFCYFVASVIPNLYKAIAASWMHMVRVEWKAGPGNFLLGLISFTAVSWISGWLFAMTYNYFAGKK